MKTAPLLREHRGHRLGTLVKLENLRRAARQWPDVRVVSTWNDPDNRPMVAGTHCRTVRVSSAIRSSSSVATTSTAGDAPATLMRTGPVEASAANGATANSSQRRATEDASEVNDAVRAWVDAWERKDMDAYIGAYVPGFRGSDASVAEWQSTRRQRIVGKRSISIELSGVTVELLPDNLARVSFRQPYSADQFRALSRKVLELVKRDGKWLIRKESVV